MPPLLNRAMLRALSPIAAKTSGQSIVLGVIILAHAAKVARESTGAGFRDGTDLNVRLRF
jgi:hypothetical protein